MIKPKANRRTHSRPLPRLFLSQANIRKVKCRDKEGEKVFDRTLSGRTLIPQIYEKGMGTGK